MKRKFTVYAEIEIEVEMESEIAELGSDPEWADLLYGPMSPEEIAEYLAWNCGLRGAGVSRLDGFADRNDEDVRCRIVSTNFEGKEHA